MSNSSDSLASPARAAGSSPLLMNASIRCQLLLHVHSHKPSPLPLTAVCPPIPPLTCCEMRCASILLAGRSSGGSWNSPSCPSSPYRPLPQLLPGSPAGRQGGAECMWRGSEEWRACACVPHRQLLR